MFEWVMAAEPTPNPPDDERSATRAPIVDVLLRGTRDCPATVVVAARAVSEAASEQVVGDLTTGGGLADRVTVLARTRTAMDAEIGRSLLAAERADALPHAPRTQLERLAAWSGHSAAALVTAARFADRNQDVGGLWSRGLVSTDVIAALARGLSGLTADTERGIVKAVVPELPSLSVRAVKVVVAHALDMLHPDDRDAAEQSEYDRRTVVSTTHGGMIMITADLPGLEGEAVMAAINAVAESLRLSDDRLTAGQRRADALITLVNRAAACGDIPATAGGLPVGVTVTMGAAEADRVLAGRARSTASKDLTEPTDSGNDPAALATTRSRTLGDAAAHFALCTATLTPAIVADHDCVGAQCTADGHTGRTLTEALLATPTQPLALGRSTRLATPAQRTALALRDGGCLLCQRPPSECQTHHVTEWSQGGSTDVSNMVLLCWSHHRQVDLNRWNITRNPDRSPGASYWTIASVPRHRWRRSSAHSHAA